MDLTANEILLAVLGAAGIPSAVVSLLVWKLQRRIELRDQKRQEEEKEQEKSREKLELLIIKGNGAALALAEATARAVERIPDAHCNGDMHSALEYATSVKHDLKNFMEEQSVNAIVH